MNISYVVPLRVGECALLTSPKTPLAGVRKPSTQKGASAPSVVQVKQQQVATTSHQLPGTTAAMAPRQLSTTLPHAARGTTTTASNVVVTSTNPISQPPRAVPQSAPPPGQLPPRTMNLTGVTASAPTATTAAPAKGPRSAVRPPLAQPSYNVPQPPGGQPQGHVLGGRSVPPQPRPHMPANAPPRALRAPSTGTVVAAVPTVGVPGPTNTTTITVTAGTTVAGGNAGRGKPQPRGLAPGAPTPPMGGRPQPPPPAASPLTAQHPHKKIQHQHQQARGYVSEGRGVVVAGRGIATTGAVPTGSAPQATQHHPQQHQPGAVTYRPPVPVSGSIRMPAGGRGQPVVAGTPSPAPATGVIPAGRGPTYVHGANPHVPHGGGGCGNVYMGTQQPGTTVIAGRGTIAGAGAYAGAHVPAGGAHPTPNQPPPGSYMQAMAHSATVPMTTQQPGMHVSPGSRKPF